MAENLNAKETESVSFTTSEKIKILIDRDPDMNATKLSRLLGYSKQKISSNLNRNSLRTSDLDKMADLLGYEVTFTKKS